MSTSWTEQTDDIIDKVVLTFQDVSADECGKSVVCFKSPSSCTSSLDCEMLALYKYDADNSNISVTIATKSTSKYIGWAHSTASNGMVCGLFAMF